MEGIVSREYLVQFSQARMTHKALLATGEMVHTRTGLKGPVWRSEDKGQGKQRNR
jgi:hypothetical protein